jgi:pentatricopeptide repeat protein
MSAIVLSQGASMATADVVMESVHVEDEMESLVFEVFFAAVMICVALYMRRNSFKKLKAVKHNKKIAEYADIVDVKITKVENVKAKVENVKVPVKPHMETLDDSKLMREVGQCIKENDLRRAVDVMEKATARGFKEAHIHNAGLLICAATGDVTTARQLLESIKKITTPTPFSYNTFIKVYISNKDHLGAKSVLEEMRAEGIAPNSVTYNLVANLAATSGDLRAVSECVEAMEASGVEIDRYTVGILFKAVKKDGSKHDSLRVLELMDKYQINAASDPVLLSTFLEVCMKYGLKTEMSKVLNGPLLPTLRLLPHTYNMVIQAWEKLDQVDRCLSMWNEMVNQRGMSPSKQTVGAMVDALVRNECTDIAKELLEKFRSDAGDWYQSLWWKCAESSRSTTCSEGSRSMSESSSSEPELNKNDNAIEPTISAKAAPWRRRSVADLSDNWRAA